jgi:uncharacterized protein YegP (UPF0339 family)
VPGRFVLKRGTTGKFRFHLLSANGKVIASGAAHETKAAALRGLESVRKNAPDARVDDQTTGGTTAASKRRVVKKGKGVGAALERDWEQTKADLPGLKGKNLRQGVGDTLKQAVGKEPTPAKKKPNRGG